MVWRFAIVFGVCGGFISPRHLLAEPLAITVSGNGLEGCTKRVPIGEGTYDVTVALGSDDADSVTTVKAESRRLMLENVMVPKGGHEHRTFTVNVRRPEIGGSGKTVKLKARELATNTWDDALTLEFSGSGAAVRCIEITPAPDAPTVFLAGDSTVTDQWREPWNSWGQMLPRFLKPGVAVANYANSGETLRSSMGSGRFDKIFSLMRPGDYLLLQFGHNDMKDKRPEALEAYRRQLAAVVVRVQERGGTPILVTSMERKAGRDRDTLGDYPQAVRDVAVEQRVFLIDLHTMSKTLYEALGDDLGKAFQDGSHHNAYGSYLLAKCVASTLAKGGLSLADKVTPDAAAFDPARPDSWHTFAVPPSPQVDLSRPEGD